MATLAKSVSALACTWSNVSFLPADDVTACIRSIPFHQQWRDGTVETLRKLLAHYVLIDDLTESGPPANLRRDLMGELDRIQDTEYERDWDMQSDFARLFLGNHDSHTKYKKPGAYRNIYYAQPFAMKVTSEGESQKFWLDAETREGILAHLGNGFSELQGLEILAIDGVKPVAAVTRFADEAIVRSQDQGTRFNIALFKGYFMKRLVYYHDIPARDMQYLLRDPTDPNQRIAVTIPWTVIPVKSSKSINVTEANCVDSSSSTKPKKTAGVMNDPISPSTWVANGAPPPSSWVEELAEKPLWLYTKGDTAVLKMDSFSPKEIRQHCSHVQRAFKIMQERGVQNLVVDLLQNGGGSVCVGYDLVRMLVPELREAPPSLYEGIYDIPWNEDISRALRQENQTLAEVAFHELGLDRRIDARTGALVTDGVEFYDNGPRFIRGKNLEARRSNGFYLDCDETNTTDKDHCDLSAPPVSFPKERLLVLTDGYCGSTCATVMHRLQAGNYVTVAGVGGIKHMPMSTSSFAGGFTGDMDDINDILMPTDQIPDFPHNGGVSKFAWGELYDYRRRFTPAQYSWSQPDMRLDYWEFTAQLGALYDLARAQGLPAETISI